MNKEELFYEAESKTARPHKYSIKYKNDDVIYPSMVIRSQAETIELLEKENKKLQKEKDHYKHLYSEVKKQKDDVVEYIKKDWYSKNTIDINKVVIGDWRIDILRMLGEKDE